jgi:HSP20 family molecular chaperone IbpA
LSSLADFQSPMRRGDQYVVEMDLPGVDPSSIEVHTEQKI